MPSSIEKGWLYSICVLLIFLAVFFKDIDQILCQLIDWPISFLIFFSHLDKLQQTNVDHKVRANFD